MEVVGNLGKSVYGKHALVLVSNLMRGTPCLAGTCSDIGDNVAHCVLVVVAVSPTAAHVTAEVAKRNTMVVEILAVVNTTASCVHRLGVVVDVAVFCAPVLVPTWVKSVERVHLSLAQETHCRKL